MTAASGTGHNIGTACSIQRGQVPTRLRWREVGVPEAEVTVLVIQMMGAVGTRKHVE